MSIRANFKSSFQLADVAAVTRYADKTRHSDKITMILTNMKTNSELFLCASDLSMCRKMNVLRLNMKTVKKNKMKFF